MQAKTAGRSQAVAGLPSPSQVADAQPPDGSEGSALSLGQAAAGTAVAESVSNSVVGSSTAAGSSQEDSQPGATDTVETAGDDLEQVSKQELKAGQHASMLDKASEQQQQEDKDAEQAQREAFAAATLRAFQAKLAGRDMSKSEAVVIEDVSVEKHADQLIKQATSLTTLCQMYEGWTAWI